MKRLLSLITLICFCAGSVFQADAISAQSAIVLDAATGRTLYEKDANRRSLIASTTKIMTALVVCEQCNVLDRMVIPPQAIGIEGSSVYLQTGEIWTIQDLLYAMMLHSGNDAATALAIYCGGTVEGFAEMMNDKAVQLGLHNTHFTNPHGLDSPQHYSSASDLAVLSAYAMKNPIFNQTVSAKTVHVGERLFKNHNRLLWLLEGVDGVKTGYTKAAGRILVSSATRQGRRLVAVTINAPDDWKDHQILLENGFSQYSVSCVVEEGACVGQVYVAGSENMTVPLIAARSFSWPLTEQEKTRIELPPYAFVYAPVAEGEDAGVAYVCLENTIIGKIPLIYGETIEKTAEPELSFWEKIRKGLKR